MSMGLDDAGRYEELTRQLWGLLEEDAVLRGEQRVAADDLALYLEWLELARETAPTVAPFTVLSSPYALANLSYRQLASDFRWLRDQLVVGAT